MKTLHFATIIAANRETVWKAMLAPDTYKVWTSVFADGSYFEGSWAKGARVRFLTPDGSGMTSVIAENQPNQFISIQHLGYIKNWVEDTESEQVRSWAPFFENYHFSVVGQSTGLKVAIDVASEFEEYMTNVWPKALAMLKAICESSLATRSDV